VRGADLHKPRHHSSRVRNRIFLECTFQAFVQRDELTMSASLVVKLHLRALQLALQVTPQAECDSSVEELVSQHAARTDSTESH